MVKQKRYLKDIEKSGNDSDIDSPEFDMKSEALIPLFKKKTKAFFHCHRADDIFTAVRISKEFDIDYALIHCTEGYLIADILAGENVQAIAGPILCDRCKLEMKRLSLKNAAALNKENILTAICTDHPVVPIQYLPISALAAVKGGLSKYEALKAITINAAIIAGIDTITGSIAPGLDADLQLYHSEPLDLLSEPEFVMINGIIIDSK